MKSICRLWRAHRHRAQRHTYGSRHQHLRMVRVWCREVTLEATLELMSPPHSVRRKERTNTCPPSAAAKKWQRERRLERSRTTRIPKHSRFCWRSVTPPRTAVPSGHVVGDEAGVGPVKKDPWEEREPPRIGSGPDLTWVAPHAQSCAGRGWRIPSAIHPHPRRCRARRHCAHNDELASRSSPTADRGEFSIRPRVCVRVCCPGPDAPCPRTPALRGRGE